MSCRLTVPFEVCWLADKEQSIEGKKYFDFPFQSPHPVPSCSLLSSVLLHLVYLMGPSQGKCTCIVIMATVMAFWNLLKLNQYMHLCSAGSSPQAFNDRCWDFLPGHLIHLAIGKYSLGKGGFWDSAIMTAMASLIKLLEKCKWWTVIQSCEMQAHCPPGSSLWLR